MYFVGFGWYRLMEECLSGLKERSWKPSHQKWCREFESHLLRHFIVLFQKYICGSFIDGKKIGGNLKLVFVSWNWWSALNVWRVGALTRFRCLAVDSRISLGLRVLFAKISSTMAIPPSVAATNTLFVHTRNRKAEWGWDGRTSAGTTTRAVFIYKPPRQRRRGGWVVGRLTRQTFWFGVCRARFARWASRWRQVPHRSWP